MNPIDSSDSTMPAKQPHAVYSERLLPALAQRLAAAGLKRVDARELRRFRLFYSVCPQIRETLSPTLFSTSPSPAWLSCWTCPTTPCSAEASAPESLPPAEDVKKVERRLAAGKKQALKNPHTLDGE